MTMKRKKKTLFAVLAVVAIAAFLGIWGIKSIEANLQQLTYLHIQEADLSQLKDGSYTGSYKVFPVSAEVEVIIKNHSITGIELLKHTHGQGGAAEAIPGKVIEAQSLQVDTISSATYSSKVILKAIEQACSVKEGF